MVTVTIDDSRMRQRLAELHEALIGSGSEGDSSALMEDEARRFLKGVIMLTPPRNKAQGQAAVTRDLNKIFTPINEEFLNEVGSQFGTTNIDHWLTSPASGKKYHIKWDRLDPSGKGMEDFHRRSQDRRGRTRNLKRVGRGPDRWYAPYVVAFSDFADYLKKIISHVGRRKAGWGISFQSVGGKLPKWIREHVAAAKGFCDNRLDTPNHPEVEMRNYSPGIADDERIVRDQFKIRSESIGRRIRLIISGYAEDVAKGMKISRRVERQEQVVNE